MVTVKGTMDPQKLVEFISKKGGRYAEIVKQSEKENGCGMREGDCRYSYDSHQVYAPQFFSDENPNSCSAMWRIYQIRSQIIHTEKNGVWFVYTG